MLVDDHGTVGLLDGSALSERAIHLADATGCDSCFDPADFDSDLFAGRCLQCHFKRSPSPTSVTSPINSTDSPS